MNWSNVAAGTYVLTAVATDDDNVSTTSAPVSITVPTSTPPTTPGATTAAFVGTDTTTSGSWKGVYGTQGYALAALPPSYPSYAQVATSAGVWTWAASTAAGRGLQKPGAATDRVAACWFGGVFTIDVNFTDGAEHQIALYGVDWDTAARGQSIEILDAATGVVLDRRTVGGFSSGHYWVWKVRGRITIRLRLTAGANAVLSGLFFDPVR